MYQNLTAKPLCIHHNIELIKVTISKPSPSIADFVPLHLGAKNKGLAVSEVDTHLAVAAGSMRTSAKDILPGGVGSLGEQAMLAIVAGSAVDSDDEEVATVTGPGVAGVGDVDMVVVVVGETTVSLAGGTELGHGLVHVGVGVEVGAPEILTVGGVGATGVALLGTVVDNRDTTGEDDKCKGVLEQGEIVLLVKPAVIVVVVEECSESSRVRELGADSVDHVDKSLGRALLLVKVVHGVVGGIVEEAAHEFVVTSKIIRVAVKDLADSVDARVPGKLGPETLGDVLDCVDADTVKLELGNEPLDPVLEELLHGSIFSVNVVEDVSDHAILNAALVGVVDVARSVVSAGLVQGRGAELAVVTTSHVVGNNIDHHVNSLDTCVR